MISETPTVRTTDSPIRWMKLQIWHFSSLHSGAFLLAKSVGMLAFPAKCWMVTWYLLAVAKNVETRGLAENSPRCIFW